MVKKFGLDELEKYTKEIGFKKGDTRIIKGVLSICNIPNKITEEAEAAISQMKADVEKLIAKKEELREEDAKDEADTSWAINELRIGRKDRKKSFKEANGVIDNSVNDVGGRVSKLENIIKKFS